MNQSDSVHDFLVDMDDDRAEDFLAYGDTDSNGVMEGIFGAAFLVKKLGIFSEVTRLLCLAKFSEVRGVYD